MDKYFSLSNTQKSPMSFKVLCILAQVL